MATKLTRPSLAEIRKVLVAAFGDNANAEANAAWLAACTWLQLAVAMSFLSHGATFYRVNNEAITLRNLDATTIIIREDGVVIYQATQQ